MMEWQKNRRKKRAPKKNPESFWKRRARERQAERRAERRARVAAGIPTGLAWFVASTAPQGEQRAADSLLELGITTYLPEHKVTVIQRRRKLGERVEIEMQLDRPYFIGYVFVGLDPERLRFADVAAADGVSSLVHFDGVPSRIDPKLLIMISEKLSEKMEAAEQAAAELARKKARGEPVHGFEKGQMVGVTSGPFAGQDIFGQIERLVGAGAVKLLVPQRGVENGMVRIEVPVAMLSAA